MNQLTAQEILDGIRMKDNNVLRLVYKDNYSVIEKFILRNSGNSFDAEDIFQEAIIIIYRRVINNKLFLDCSFNTYLFSVCKVLWHEDLRNRKKIYPRNLEEEAANHLDDTLLSMKDDFDKRNLIQKHLMKLNSDCRKLLMLFYNNVPLIEISQIFGFSGENYAKKRKFSCKEKLIELIKNDPLYKEIMNSD